MVAPVLFLFSPFFIIRFLFCDLATTWQLQGLARWGASAPFAPLLCQLSQHQSIPHVIEHNLFEKYIFRFSWFFLAFLLLVLAEALNSHNTNQSPISWSTICLKICFFYNFLVFSSSSFLSGFRLKFSTPETPINCPCLKAQLVWNVFYETSCFLRRRNGVWEGNIKSQVITWVIKSQVITWVAASVWSGGQKNRNTSRNKQYNKTNGLNWIFLFCKNMMQTIFWKQADMKKR